MEQPVESLTQYIEQPVRQSRVMQADLGPTLKPWHIAVRILIAPWGYDIIIIVYYITRHPATVYSSLPRASLQNITPIT